MEYTLDAQNHLPLKEYLVRKNRRLDNYSSSDEACMKLDAESKARLYRKEERQREELKRTIAKLQQQHEKVMRGIEDTQNGVTKDMQRVQKSKRLYISKNASDTRGNSSSRPSSETSGRTRDVNNGQDVGRNSLRPISGISCGSECGRTTHHSPSSAVTETRRTTESSQRIRAGAQKADVGLPTIVVSDDLVTQSPHKARVCSTSRSDLLSTQVSDLTLLNTEQSTATGPHESARPVSAVLLSGVSSHSNCPSRPRAYSFGSRHVLQKRRLSSSSSDSTPTTRASRDAHRQKTTPSLDLHARETCGGDGARLPAKERETLATTGPTTLSGGVPEVSSTARRASLRSAERAKVQQKNMVYPDDLNPINPLTCYYLRVPVTRFTKQYYAPERWGML